MTSYTLNYSEDKRIRLVVVDDSELFRKFIHELLAESTVICIVGEVGNGEDAVDLLGRVSADVVLLDMEMPGMDGMCVLRQLMAENPLPVIMVSGLSREGSARSYDALKLGAVDFIGKDALHPKKGLEQLRKELPYRIICASRVHARDRGERRHFESLNVSGQVDRTERIIFCEDCGARNVIEVDGDTNGDGLTCSQCGDLLDAIIINKYRRVSSVGVVCVGHGGVVNLLNIIPRLPETCNSTLIVVMYEPENHVDMFTRYISAISKIKVIRLVEGMNIEGGNCYIAAAHEYFCMVSHSTNFTIRTKEPEPGHGAFDLMLSSLSGTMKNRLFVMALSGQQLDGVKGMGQVRSNHGHGVVLNAASCLCKELGENILKNSVIDRIVSEDDCVELICRYQNGNGALPMT